MAGHNKWTQIKRQKAVTDGKRSKIFSKFARLIALESKKANGNVSAPGLKTAIEKAKSFNMPNDNIDRAIKKGTGGESGSMEPITYEAYGPGGAALIIEALTDNRNKAAQEVKFILSKHNSALGAVGSASWAFSKVEGVWTPNLPVPISSDDFQKLEALIDELEENDEVQDVYTNAETA
jgi:YebC/PmpR family DNA-binding regulatory protein